MLCLWWASHVAETFQRFWVLVGYYGLPIISYLASIAFCLMDQWYVALNSLCFQLLWKSVLKCLIRERWLDALCLNYCSAAMLSACLMSRSECTSMLMWGLHVPNISKELPGLLTCNFFLNNIILINNCSSKCCFYKIVKLYPVGYPAADRVPIG